MSSEPVVRLDHFSISCSDLPEALRFYTTLLAPLGLVPLIELSDEEEEPGEVDTEAVGFGHVGEQATQALLWLVAVPMASGAQETVATAGVHVGMRTYSREQVDRFHTAALAAGARSRQAPRRWEIFRVGYYGASVYDKADNVIEVFTDLSAAHTELAASG